MDFLLSQQLIPLVYFQKFEADIPGAQFLQWWRELTVNRGGEMHNMARDSYYHKYMKEGRAMRTMCRPSHASLLNLMLVESSVSR